LKIGFPLERIDSTGFMVGNTAYLLRGCMHGKRIPADDGTREW